MLPSIAVTAEIRAVHQPHIGGTPGKNHLNDFACLTISEVVLNEVHKDTLQSVISSKPNGPLHFVGIDDIWYGPRRLDIPDSPLSTSLDTISPERIDTREPEEQLYYVMFDSVQESRKWRGVYEHA